jgi:hypothetical protein
MSFILFQLSSQNQLRRAFHVKVKNVRLKLKLTGKFPLAPIYQFEIIGPKILGFRFMGLTVGNNWTICHICFEVDRMVTCAKNNNKRQKFCSRLRMSSSIEYPEFSWTLSIHPISSFEFIAWYIYNCILYVLAAYYIYTHLL